MPLRRCATRTTSRPLVDQVLKNFQLKLRLNYIIYAGLSRLTSCETKRVAIVVPVIGARLIPDKKVELVRVCL
jgi:hypothetical protein